MAPSMTHYAEAKTSAHRGRKKLHHLEVEKAKNGGHTVTHHYHSSEGAYHEPDKYAFGSGPETVAHLMKHLGVKENEMIDHLQGGDEEEPGGRPDHEEASSKIKGEHHGHRRTEEEEGGED